jgi:hypothetical protein
MKRFIIAVCFAAIAVSGCTKGEQNGVSSNAADMPANQAPPANTAQAAPPEPGTPGGLRDDRTPLREPQGTIDPKSAEAAGQVMQSYGALIEQKRFAEAERLWAGPVAGKTYSNGVRANPENHLQVGKPGDMEGAAGSSYVSVPIVLYGVDSTGKSFSRSGEAVLRRVNDVPGSTEAQRRWHIEQLKLPR